MERAEALRRVGAVSFVAWSGEAYRHTAPRFDPLSGGGSRITGGRWNPRGLFGAVYLAQPRETCIGEFRRMVLSQGASPRDFLPRAFYCIEVTGLRVLDLRTIESLEAVGLSHELIAESEWNDCQVVAEAAHFLGAQGVVAPSATGAGIVIAAFDDRIEGHLVVKDVQTVEFDE